MDVQGAEEGALRSILSSIHMYPQNGKLWTVLSQYLINIHLDGRRARHALLTAYALGEGVTLPGIALTYLMDADFEVALKMAQLALRQTPTSLPSLAVMVATLGAKYVQQRLPLLRRSLLSKHSRFLISHFSSATEGRLEHSVSLAQKALTQIPNDTDPGDIYTADLRTWIQSYVELNAS
jgi:hypothetical protein